MGLLSNYAAIHNYTIDVEPVKPYSEEEQKSVTVLADAKQVTIAEISPIAKGKITAHKLKDYRRKSFSLILLPDIDLMLDKLLEEKGNIHECPEFTSTNLE